MRRLIKAAMLAALTGTALVSCAPSTPKTETAATSTQAAETQPTETQAMAPSKTGYADVNGIKLYHEIYGSGEPMVLIHGGLTTIGEMQSWIRPLAKSRQVIAVEMQGHGHTADTDRPMSWDQMADDVAALLDELKIPTADLVGHSFGGASAIRAAIRHPDKVRRLVVVSAPAARSAWYPEVQKGMGEVSAAMAESMMQTPTGKLTKDWPEPQRFPKFLDKLGKMMSTDYDWSADVKKLPMPVMLVFTDNDSVSQKHIAEFFALLGGGVKEPGWQNTQLSKARLAIVPGYSHYNFISSPEIAPIIDKYLADPLANPTTGAAAASQVAPDNTKQ